jgi:hypothetical protein
MGAWIPLFCLHDILLLGIRSCRDLIIFASCHLFSPNLTQSFFSIKHTKLVEWSEKGGHSLSHVCHTEKSLALFGNEVSVKAPDRTRRTRSGTPRRPGTGARAGTSVGVLIKAGGEC